MPDLHDLAAQIVAEALSNQWASGDDPEGIWRRRGSQSTAERTLADLTAARNATRRLLEGSQFDDGNEYAIGAAQNRVNYAVGDAGIKFEPVSARGRVAPPELLAEVQRWLDRFAEANDLVALQRETVWRMDRDGEAFLRLFPSEGAPEVAFVQPERVYAPGGGTTGTEFARAGGAETAAELVAPWGIIRPTDNPRRILGYWVDPGNEHPVQVPEPEIVHLKLNVTSEFERGWPTFEPVRRALIRAEELLVAMTASGKVRAKIALITTVPGWNAAKAANLAAQLTTRYQDQPSGEPPRQESTEELPYGAHLRVRDGTTVTFPPPGLGASELVDAIQANLRAAGARLVMPEWMFTLVADAKYSNAFVVEAPTLRMFRDLQELVAVGFGRGRYKQRASLIWRAMRMSAALGQLTPAALDLCEIKATPPSLETRDKSAEASANIAYIQAGVKPVALVQREIGVDPDEARKLAEQYPPPAPPGAPAPEPTPPDAAPPQPDPTAMPVGEALAALVGRWLTEGGVARAGGNFPDSEHFGVTEEGERWVSESLYALVSEAGKQGLVAKKIQKVSKTGKQYEQTVWVKPDEVKAADKAAKQKAKEEGTKEKQKAADEAKHQRFKTVTGALADPKSVTPKKLAEALKGMTAAELKTMKEAAGVKGGKTKAEITTKLLDHVKQKKEAIKLAEKKLKDLEKAKALKPDAIGKLEQNLAAATAKADAAKAKVAALKGQRPPEPQSVPVPSASAPKPEPVDFAAVQASPASVAPKDAIGAAKAKVNPAQPKKPKPPAQPNTPAAGVQHLTGQGATDTAPAFGGAPTGTAGGKPTAHVQGGTASAGFKQAHPHASAAALNDPNAGSAPNAALPDHTRPPTPDLKTATYLNNYSWGYDGPMNRALRTTDAPPPGDFGGSAGGKPSKSGPEMHAALQEHFAKAKPFAPPPIAVTRGLINANAATAERLAKVAEQAIATGGTVRMPGYVSTTVGNASDFQGKVTFKINAVHGLDLKPYSHFPTENELLLNHNAEYKVRKVEGDPNSFKGVTIYLDQVTTGGAKTSVPKLA